MINDTNTTTTMHNDEHAYPDSIVIEGLENAAWDDAGHPTNLNAAVVDGLEWLAMFRSADLLEPDAAAKLNAAISNLERFSGATPRVEWERLMAEGRLQIINRGEGESR
jgi:hypothetical protein